MAEWLTSASPMLATLWPDGDLVDPDTMDLYLAAAKAECLAFAPEPPALIVQDGFVVPAANAVPDEWVIAQVLHARNKYNAGAVGPTGATDGSGYGLTAFPLDWQVKQLLRPQRGMGAIV